MHNPPHPGEVLKELWLDPERLTISETAKSLGLSRKHVSAIVNGRASVTADIALRLEAAFGKSAESWLGHQMTYDLWHLKQGDRPEIQPLCAA